jgi:putative hydrolase of HD superfamily
MAEGLTGLARFFYEIGLLKRYKRTGWFIVGVRDPESIADHSFRTAIIATTLAAMEDADPERTALLSLFHDSQETRITDIPHLGRRYLTARSNDAVTADQTRDLPRQAADVVRRAVGEYEARTSRESLCAHDADRLECLIQAVEYGEQGYHNVRGWIDNSLANLVTASAQKLAKEILNMNSLDWHDRSLDDAGDEQTA